MSNETKFITELEAEKIYSRIKFGKTISMSNVIKNLDINQIEFAQRVNYTEVYVSQIASKSIKISDKALAKVCLAAGRDVTTELIRSALYVRFGESVFSDYQISTYLIETFIKSMENKYGEDNKNETTEKQS